MIDEDPFPSMALVNIATTNFESHAKCKEDWEISLSVGIRKVWIPKQYLLHMDDLTVRRRVSTAKEREKNGRYPYH